MARIRDISSYKTFALAAGWELAGVSPGAAAAPDDLAQVEWVPASVPGTVAAALQAQGRWRLGSADDFDATDWWYRCRFAGPPAAPGCLTYLRLEGLATIAEVFCNGVRILQSENMYLAHAVEVTQLLRADNELCIVFRSLARLLQERRPRPRWRTRLVEPQQLRFFRTTLLGRMPSFCPPVAPIGPCGPAGPIGPVAPISPCGPCGPAGPIGPMGPVAPSSPCGPCGPAGPIGPMGPIGPVAPTSPAGPAGPMGPMAPAGPAGPAGPAQS